ncbi:hypothetical protein [Planococcus lenghuensis]|uniref:Uncharacterized protein n=1 Tax=Planococcus lenghuensis TaxID=2213202 RepID=A0A1Q2KUS7_9BACL|nr:hypothetical protein [Planococcus lenghuensis]AQQ51876.1 hypothetical protein B0X71_01245 [Planococcus lenghuensis]
MADKKWEEKMYESREEREQIGRQTNARSAQGEKSESAGGSERVLTASIELELSDEEIRKRVGSGNFDSAKDDRQSNSINS